MNTRPFHPGIWWIWAGATVIALARESNFLLSCFAISIAALVVVRKSEDPIHAPWVASFAWSLRLGLWIVVIRTAVGVLIGVPTVGRNLFVLPTIPLPTWLAGIRIGGPVTQERLFSTAQEGIMLATIVVVLAAAAALTNPHRLLRSLPVVVYEIGVAVVIATTLVPQLVATIGRIREAQRLRGQSPKGLRSWKRVALPLLEESLSRSLDLAAAMDSRGYGISSQRSRYRATRWQWNEYLILALGAATLVLPMLSLVLLVTPLALAPRLRKSMQILGQT